MAASHRHQAPEGVGILALQVYFPQQKIDQRLLEEADGCVGKYTIGLGQEEMAFCTDREDVVSMALTVTSNLLAAYCVSPTEVGHLQVGTESSLDRSKSIKSHLMRLFTTSTSSTSSSGAAATSTTSNHDIEGVDCVHGCYGATAALLNAVAWVESRAWDGRLALVVAADAPGTYAPGSPARATGGCGAAAMLVGPAAPLVLDPAWRACYAQHTEEFCKPAGGGPHPLVDGQASVGQYLRALDKCAARLHARLQARGLLQGGPGLLRHADHWVGHAPFHKMVAKAFGRLVWQDALRAHRRYARGAPAPAPSSQQRAGQCSSGSNGAAARGAAEEEGAWGRPAGVAAEPSGPPGHREEEGEEGGAAECSCSCGGAGAGGSVSGERPLGCAACWLARVRSGLSAQQLAADPDDLPLPAGSVGSSGSAAAAGTCTGTGPEFHAARQAQPQQQANSLSPPEARALDGALGALCKGLLEGMVAPGAWLQKQVGNTYTACVWFGLASLLARARLPANTQAQAQAQAEQQPAVLGGSSILLFSFGSGTMASLLMLRCCDYGADPPAPGAGTPPAEAELASTAGPGSSNGSGSGEGPSGRFLLPRLQAALARDIQQRLARRVPAGSVADLEEAGRWHEACYAHASKYQHEHGAQGAAEAASVGAGAVAYVPRGAVPEEAGVWYLDRVEADGRRAYAQAPGQQL